MRTSLLIAACFLTIIILNFIPIASTYETVGDYVFISDIGLLPNTITFSLICLMILAFIIALTNKKFKQPINGHFKIKRKDLNLQTHYLILGLWAVFVFVSGLYLSKIVYFFNWTTSYFIIILAIFLAYYLYTKSIIRKAKPEFLSLNSGKIFLRNSFRNSKRKIADLRSIDYDVRQNSIELRFEEGLNNISLYLADYELNDILSLIEEIKHIKGADLSIGENFRKTFGNT